MDLFYYLKPKYLVPSDLNKSNSEVGYRFLELVLSLGCHLFGILDLLNFLYQYLEGYTSAFILFQLI